MKMFGLADLEKMSGVPQRTWRYWMAEGRLEYARLGRRLVVTEEQLRRFMADCSTPEAEATVVAGTAAARAARS
jgi:hypothetical protein